MDTFRSLVCAAALVVAGGTAFSADSAPADKPVPAGESAEERPWGENKAGLQASAVLVGQAKAGGGLTFDLAVRNVGQGAVSLGAASEVFVWGFIVQGTSSQLFTEKVYPARDLADWSRELGPGRTVRFQSIDVSDLNAYTYRKGLKIVGGYPAAEEGKLAPAGKTGKLMIVGDAKVRWMVYLPGERAVMLVSNTLDVPIAPPDFASLSPGDQKAFAEKLITQYKRDAWGGQAAHAVAMQIGPPIVPYLIEALDGKLPDYARMWMGTSLCHIRDARAVEALLGHLRKGGLTAIIAYHGPAQRDDKLDQAIIETVSAGGDPHTIALAVLGFMGSRKDVPARLLEVGLDSQDPRARAMVAEAFAQHAGEGNVLRLVELLKDKDEKVRATSARLLGKLGNRSWLVFEALVNALDSPGEYARQRACAALSELSGRPGAYDPQAPQQERLKVIAGWKAWLAEAKAGKE